MVGEELTKKVEEVKVPPSAKRKKITHNTETITPTPKNAIAGPSTQPPTSQTTSADRVVAEPSEDITPGKKRKSRAKKPIGIQNGEKVVSGETMDMSSIPKGFTHAEAAEMLFGPPDDISKHDRHILASLLDIPQILNATANQIAFITSYGQTIIKACGGYISDAVFSQSPDTLVHNLPPLRLISNISEILCRFLPRILRNLAESQENTSEILICTQVHVIGECIKSFYHLSLWDDIKLPIGASPPLREVNRNNSQDVAFALVQFLHRLIDATSHAMGDMIDESTNNAIAEMVASQSMGQIVHLRQREYLRVEAEKRELQMIQANKARRNFLHHDPITTEMYKRKQESIASDQAQHYLITLVSHAIPHLPLNHSKLHISSLSGPSRNSLVFSVRSMLLNKLLGSGVLKDSNENRVSAVSQRLIGLAEKLSLAEDEEHEAFQRAIDNALHVVGGA